MPMCWAPPTDGPAHPRSHSRIERAAVGDECGSALFMHRLTMHSSLRNVSDGVRWIFDLRYQPFGQPTGRDWLPAFVARSREHPSQEIHDWRRWGGSVVAGAQLPSPATPSPQI